MDGNGETAAARTDNGGVRAAAVTWGPIDLAALQPVDRINLRPGFYVTTEPVEVLAGAYAVRVEVDDFLVVSPP